MPGPTDPLKWLENLKIRAEQLHREEAAAIAKIRSSFVERAVVFLDVVNSTAFKIEHQQHPERWILRVVQFSELLAQAVRTSNGEVVKFIGDEVLAIYSSVYDAQNLVGRVAEIETSLTAATGFPTRIKVAADFGRVYLLEFEGHVVPDPQGTPVDRCARIAKYATAGEVLASQSFAAATPKLRWKKAGSAELKGLGREPIYQLGDVTVDVTPKIEVSKEEYDELVEARDDLKIQLVRCGEQNRQLQEQVAAAGGTPDPDAVAEPDGKADAWDRVVVAARDFKKLLSSAPVPSKQYARFVFLHVADQGGEEYNKFEGRTFDGLVENNLVRQIEDSGYYSLDPEHARNRKVLKSLDAVEKALDGYLRHYEPDANDLFEWSIKDPEFWRNYLGFDVSK